jgi:pimeloyl-ACP methyl ester carboxylesterase
MLNSFRTRGVEAALLTSDARVIVTSSRESLTFKPVQRRSTGLLFIVGAGVAAEAYAPLLRPVAAVGFTVAVVRLPYRIAPLERHKQVALERAGAVLRGDQAIGTWVIAGHSLGAALACRLAAENPPGVAAMTLIATTHPKTMNLSALRMPVTKVYGTNDGVATVKDIDANRPLLPPGTRWIEIEGGNHSQFAHYGRQLFDGSPTIPREQQQERTRAVLLDALEHAEHGNERALLQ